MVLVFNELQGYNRVTRFSLWDYFPFIVFSSSVMILKVVPYLQLQHQKGSDSGGLRFDFLFPFECHVN